MNIKSYVTPEKLKDLITPKNAVLCVLALGLAVVCSILYRGRKVAHIQQPSSQTQTSQNTALEVLKVEGRNKKLTTTVPAPLTDALSTLWQHFCAFNDSEGGTDPQDSFRYEAYRVSFFATDFLYFKTSIEGMGDFLQLPNEGIKMPQEQECKFCGVNENSKVTFDPEINKYLRINKLKIIRSNSNRILIVPKTHVLHFLEADHLMRSTILEAAVKVANYVQTIFPGILTNDSNELEFEFHVGAAAGQSIPHLHLRFEGGITQGILTPDQWEQAFHS